MAGSASFPGAREGAERGLAALGMARERGAPGLPRREVAGLPGVDRLAPDARHLRDVGGAALAALDLDRAHADAGEVGDVIEGVEAGGLLEGIVGVVARRVAAFAHGRIGRALAFRVAVDEDAVQARF